MPIYIRWFYGILGALCATSGFLGLLTGTLVNLYLGLFFLIIGLGVIFCVIVLERPK